MNISEIRKDYTLAELDRKDLSENPFDQFDRWLKEAIKSEVIEPTAMILATCTREGIPSSRTVLMKHFDARGIVLFTNYLSKKGREMTENPYASATFWWKELERQVTIQGTIEKTSLAESESYFSTRPRKSQLAAWASRQDTVIQSRDILEKEYARLEQEYKGKKIPTPPFWGGFRLIPVRFEFWQGRRSRLHDRFQYSLEKESWQIKRLSP